MFKSNLSSLLSSFVKLQEKLEAHAEQSTTAAIAKEDQARLLELEAASLHSEAHQAARVADRVKDMLS